MSGINLQNYTTLKTYEILAQSGITSNNTTTVNNGYYGNVGGSGQITGPGTYVPTGTPSGLNQTDVGTANTQLTQLIGDINTYTNNSLPSEITSGGSNTTVTFSPNINYNSESSIAFDTAVINFDAEGNPDAQFFIKAGSAITFTTTTMNLLNGAQACHIYWLAGTTITFTTVPVIYGNLISTTAAITFTATPIIDGHIYASGTAVTFTGDTQANAIACNPVCYVKGTKIFTDNGYKLIEDLKINDNVVTIGKIHNHSYMIPYNENTIKPVVWTGKFKLRNLTEKSRAICIKKDAFGENLPFEDLYVSPGHRIILDSKMVLIGDLVNGKTIVQDYENDSVEYYHVEFDSHVTIIANGILAESYLEMNSRNLFDKIDV